MGNCGQNDCNLLTRKKLLKVNQLGKYFGMNQITLFSFALSSHTKNILKIKQCSLLQGFRLFIYWYGFEVERNIVWH